MTDISRMESSTRRHEPLRAIVPADGLQFRRPARAETEAAAEADPGGPDRERKKGAGPNASYANASYGQAIRSYSSPFLAQVAAQHDAERHDAGTSTLPPFAAAAASYRRTSGLTVEILGAHAPVDLRA